MFELVFSSEEGGLPERRLLGVLAAHSMSTGRPLVNSTEHSLGRLRKCVVLLPETPLDRFGLDYRFDVAIREVEHLGPSDSGRQLHEVVREESIQHLQRIVPRPACERFIHLTHRGLTDESI